MGSEKEVKLVLTAEDNISSVIKKVSAALGEGGLGQSITAVSTSFMAMKDAVEVASKVIGKVYDTIAAGVKDASEAEIVNKRLAMSMMTVGQYTNESFIEINKWAGALENASGISDETYRNLVALGIQQGMNVEQSKAAVEAARNLAAATGGDLDTAFRQMSMTLSGSAGRLEKFIPELRNLTKEELEAGKGIEVISKKFDGFANNLDNTFAGATKKAEAQIGNILEAFGRMIAQNPAVIAAIESFASVLGDIAGVLDEVSTWVNQNSEDIKLFSKILLATSAAFLAYTAYINIATISTIAFNTAAGAAAVIMGILTSPITLVIAGIVALSTAIYLAYKNFDLITGAIKFGLGKALEWIMVPIGLYIQGLATIVGVFNKDWAASMNKAAENIKGFAKEMQTAGSAQMDLAKKSKDSSKQMETDALLASRATEGLTKKITEQEQALSKLKDSYSKAVQGAESAFSGLKSLMPRMALEKFEEDSKTWKKKIEDLQKYGAELKVKLTANPSSDAIKSEIEKVNQQLRFAEEGQKALRIKNVQEARNAILTEEKIRLDQIKEKEISTGREIYQMRMDFAKQMRDQQIQVETDRILKLRGLESADAQAGVDRKTQALINANQAELNAYKAHLEAQKSLALSIEEQKQLELANTKKSAMVGGTKGAADAGQDVELLQAKQKQGELDNLRQQNLISESTYQEQLTQLQINAIQSRTQQEIALNEQRAALLGTSEEALQMRLEQEKIRTEAENQMLVEKLNGQLITEQEFQLMKEEQSKASLERQQDIKEAHIQREITQNQKLKNQWGATLASIRLEQERHGKMMGFIRGVQNSQEFQATNQMLTDLGSLRQSKNKTAFAIGQAAAISQATINTFMSATAAYAALAGIPIVGPVLATAAAAAAIAAGTMNVMQIKSQKPPTSGAAHGGIDSIPASLNNSTFLLKAGERVVQPEANKDLTKAVDKINSEGNSGTTNHFNITVNGNADDSTIKKITDAIIETLRDKSERGSPILHENGIVRG